MKIRLHVLKLFNYRRTNLETDGQDLRTFLKEGLGGWWGGTRHPVVWNTTARRCLVGS